MHHIQVFDLDALLDPVERHRRDLNAGEDVRAQLLKMKADQATALARGFFISESNGGIAESKVSILW